MTSTLPQRQTLFTHFCLVASFEQAEVPFQRALLKNLLVPFLVEIRSQENIILELREDLI